MATQLLDGRYRLGRVLGRGATGAVFKAHDQELQCSVAVKMVPFERLSEPAAAARFHHHAQLIARLRHPAIVSVLASGPLPDGGAFVAMELVEGEDLRQYMSREGPMEPHRAVGVLASACEGIEAAHREHVFHGDLKPENIMLPADGGGAKVLDFGLDANTPAYMAPEQFQGVPAGAQSDVFSLAVIAYEMLCGSLPFGRGPAAAVLLAHSRGVPAMASPGVPPALERAVRLALELDVDRRTPTPQAFAHLLKAAVLD